jgi:hypothetical protein
MFRFFFVFLITLLITNQSYAQRAPQSPIPTKYYELFSDGTYGTPFFILDVGRAGQVAPTPNCDRGCRIAIAIFNDKGRTVANMEEIWYEEGQGRANCQYGLNGKKAHYIHPETGKWKVFEMCRTYDEYLEQKRKEEEERRRRDNPYPNIDRK